MPENAEERLRRESEAVQAGVRQVLEISARVRKARNNEKRIRRQRAKLKGPKPPSRISNRRPPRMTHREARALTQIIMTNSPPLDRRQIRRLIRKGYLERAGGNRFNVTERGLDWARQQ